MSDKKLKIMHNFTVNSLNIWLTLAFAALLVFGKINIIAQTDSTEDLAEALSTLQGLQKQIENLNSLPSDNKDQLPELSTIVDPRNTTEPSTQQEKVTTFQQVNLVNIWLRLAATGKSQVEIESYFSGVDEDILNRTKQNLREQAIYAFTLRLDNLSPISFNADIQARKHIARNIISHYGLEMDKQLLSELLKSYDLEL